MRNAFRERAVIGRAKQIDDPLKAEMKRNRGNIDIYFFGNTFRRHDYFIGRRDGVPLVRRLIITDFDAISSARLRHERVSVVFSGDTAPSEVLAEFARGASTLVHEATFPPALAKSFSGVRADRLLTRLARAHSPVADAARIATLAGVSQLILSPLVPSDGVGDEEWTAAARKYFSGGIVVGRDLLEVPV